MSYLTITQPANLVWCAVPKEMLSNLLCVWRVCVEGYNDRDRNALQLRNTPQYLYNTIQKFGVCKIKK